MLRFNPLFCFALLMFLFVPRVVYAWGDNGHKIICEIAFQELTPAARREVLRLIKQDQEFRYFNDSCAWPDHPRRRRSEHYVNLPRDADKLTKACPEADKCVVSAIMSDIRDLALVQDDQKKLEALKFLGHWVGDVHQPMHVSFSDDRGGNSIKESGPCSNNLHSVWDTCVIEKGLGEDPLEVADTLYKSISAADR